ncbi:hypothetical protein B0I35DRAFT_442077 [Stachybotrys elegans]|uniref:GST N-terminal domain-containing protein n=1 Tax=Stachybotrys elegans TaxID=80388 RepID=A0A8K0SKU1_9HYPO|nr:hypothetical protein B0I35DRAFT_442077 [Stachybotrys elegans]
MVTIPRRAITTFFILLFCAMTYTLYIANKRYSSWSMRPWVLLKALGIPFEEKLNIFQQHGYRQPQFDVFSPTGKVPCLFDSRSDSSKPLVIWESLAIVEYLADQHEGVWPSREKTAARAFARCAAAEMHSGFTAIRDECGMNVGYRIDLCGPPSQAVQKDLDRINTLFKQGLETFGGPWIAGDKFTAADAFFAPVACRFKTYGLQLEDKAAQEYVERLFQHPAVQEWVEAGIRETAREPVHEQEVLEGRRVIEDLSAKVAGATN